jgi:hypothetical protein
MMKQRLIGILTGMGFLVILMHSGPGSAADQNNSQTERNWQVGFSPSYLKGDYGTGSTTTITYLPVSVRRLFDDGDLTFIMPYVCVTSNGSVTLLGGVPNRVSQSGNSGSGGSGGKGKKPGNVEPVSSTDCGIGDLILRGRYYLVDEREWVPSIAVTGRIKMPTADANRGLGTGEFDEGAGLEVNKKLFGQWWGFMDFGYTLIGDPADVNLRNQWYYDLGVGHDLTKNLLLSMYYEEYRALIAGLSNPRDLLFALNYKASDLLRFNASTLVGLSDGAPDYGLTGGISWRF